MQVSVRDNNVDRSRPSGAQAGPQESPARRPSLRRWRTNTAQPPGVAATTTPVARAPGVCCFWGGDDGLGINSAVIAAALQQPRDRAFSAPADCGFGERGNCGDQISAAAKGR